MRSPAWSPRPINGRQIRLVTPEGTAAVVTVVAARPELLDERVVHFVGTGMSPAFEAACRLGANDGDGPPEGRGRSVSR